MKSVTAPVVNCPHCGKEHQWDTGNRARPFCSERCKLIDLGKWANEEYRVEQQESEFSEETAIPASFQN
jgi:endogenous inhibitor of DNA gyrase (YacG/DUF329 family)